MSTRKNGAILALAVAGFVSACHAQELFTTQDDFSGWQDNSAGTHAVGTPVATPDSDGSSTNGLGNTTNAGGTGTAGSEQIVWAQPAPGAYTYFYGPGEQNNAGFLSAIDPGSSTGNLVSYSGTISLDSTGAVGVVLNYNGNFGQFFGSTSPPNANGFSTTVIPYTINAVSGLNYFQFGIIDNSGYAGTFDLDNIKELPPGVTFSTAIASWVHNGSGNWETAANWSSNPNVPGAIGSRETFGAISGASQPVVTLSQAAYATLLDLQSPDGTSTGGYTINNGGVGSITISAQIEADSGSHTINVPVVLSEAGSTGNGGPIVVDPGASLSIPNVSNSGQYGTFYLTADDGVSNGGTFSEAGMTYCSLDVAGTWNFLGSNTGTEFFSVKDEPGSLINVGTHAIYANQLTGSGTVNIGPGGSLTLGYYNSTTYFDGAFTGSGSLIFTGLVFNSPGPGAEPQFLYTDSPSFSGPITVNGGDTLGVQSNNGLGSGASTNTVTLDNGTLQAIGSFTAAQNIIITANGGTIDTDGPAGGTGAIIPGGTAITLGAISSSASGTLTKINAGQVTAAKIAGVSLIINGGTVRLAPNGTAAGSSSLNALTLATSGGVPQGSLDITNNKVTIVAPSGSDPISNIKGYLLSGYDNGQWDGAGIQSSSVLSQPGTGIGYADGNTDTGTAAAAGTIVVMDTWLGDLNLDGSVNGADLTTLTANLGRSDAGVDWAHGDLNYDGKINGDDLSLLMLGDADYKAAGSVPVPEPATLALFATGALLPLRRRRHR